LGLSDLASAHDADDAHNASHAQDALHVPDAGAPVEPGPLDAAPTDTAPTDASSSDGGPTQTDVAADVTPCGPAQPCADDGSPCTVSVCQNGGCVPTSLPDGSPCDDGQPCTVDSCQQGACVGVVDLKVCPPKGPCETNNGGCGPPLYVSCTAAGGKAVCADIDECKTNNGGCGAKAWYTCGNQYAAPPVCTLVEGYHLPWSCGKTYTCTAGNNGTLHHTGLTKFAHDFGMPLGATIRAPRGGKVTAIYINSQPGDACYNGCPYKFGSKQFTDCCNKCMNKSNTLFLRYDDGTVGHFVHIQSATVKVGEVVPPGAAIATAGTNGCSTGPHLHTMRMVKGSDTKMGQSVPMTYIGVGNPQAGDKLKSNNCP
jgi:hypothetical protein